VTTFTVFVINQLHGPIWLRVVSQPGQIVIMAFNQPEKGCSPTVKEGEGYRFMVKTDFPSISTPKIAAKYFDVKPMGIGHPVLVTYGLNSGKNMIKIELQLDPKLLN
jgi:hypothetical protein